MRNFKIAQPQSLDQVTSLLSQKKENIFLLAGGTDLIGEIKEEVLEPEIIVDLKSIENLSYIEKSQDGVRIGALTTITELAENPVIKEEFPGLQEAAESISTPQLRNMGTVGGNLCQRPRCWYYRDVQVQCRKKGGSRCFAIRGRNKYHAILGGGLCYIVHPSDLAPMLIALNAELTVRSGKKDKKIPLADFFALPETNVRRENILGPGEIITEIKIPTSNRGDMSTYQKMKERGTWDFALVSAAVKGSLNGKTFSDIRIVLGGVAPVPWRAQAAEKMIKGKTVTEDLIRQAAKETLKEAKPLEENEYKKELVETILARAVLSLV